MARPTTKTDLMTAANGQFAKLWKLIDSMTEEKQNATFAFSDEFLSKQKETHWRRDRNLRDVLVHLYEWHRLLLNWADANPNGEPKPFLPEPYNWRTYPAMNVELWEKHQHTPLADAKKLLTGSHSEVMALIETFTNEELFSANRLAWTGGSVLGAYCASATSSHYDWAIKKLKAHIDNK
jgi:hypothetical protein